MGALRQFENKALRILLGYEYTGSGYHLTYTGSGYHLTVPQLHLPPGRRTCSEPAVIGEAGNVRCGFVAFLDNGNLVLECHTWGAIDVPEGFRELEARVNVAEVMKVGGPW